MERSTESGVAFAVTLMLHG